MLFMKIKIRSIDLTENGIRVLYRILKNIDGQNEFVPADEPLFLDKTMQLDQDAEYLVPATVRINLVKDKNNKEIRSKKTNEFIIKKTFEVDTWTWQNKGKK